MRIISGKFRGRKLTKSDHLKSLRPTTDMAREALFNILSSAKFIHEINFKIENAEILDVCCGSGAVAFEALSRGAKSAVLIDNNRDHINLARKNSENLRVNDCVEIFNYDARKLPKNEKFFDLVFIDPPYEDDYQNIIGSLMDQGWIKKGSLVVVEFETSKESKNFASQNLHQLDLRVYGKTSFAFFRS